MGEGQEGLCTVNEFACWLKKDKNGQWMVGSKCEDDRPLVESDVIGFRRSFTREWVEVSAKAWLNKG